MSTDHDMDQEIDAVLNSVDFDAQADPHVELVPAAEISSQGQMELRVASVIPLHQLPSVPAARGRGRPKKVISGPQPSELVYHAEMTRQQVAHVESDPLVTATLKGVDSTETLRLLKQRLARIQAQLDFRRMEDEKRGGREAAGILSRQVATLREIAQIELKIKEMGATTIDLRGAQMQKVFTLLVTKIEMVASEVLSQEQKDLFFNRLQTTFSGWEDEAESIIR